MSFDSSDFSAGLPAPEGRANKKRSRSAAANAKSEPEKPARAPLWFGYIRCSGVRQAESGLGLEAQEAAILEYGKRMISHRGIKQGPVLADKAETAFKKMFLLRPEAQQLQSYLQQGDHIVIARMDRGFRNTKDFVTMLDTWDKMGVYLHIANIGFDTSNEFMRPFFKMMATVLACIAEMESQSISERTRAAFDARRAKGEFVPCRNAMTPCWKVVIKNGKRHAMLDEEQCAQAREFVKLMNDGYTEWQIASHTCKKCVMWTKQRKTGETREFWEGNRILRAVEEIQRIDAMIAEGKVPTMSQVRRKDVPGASWR